MFLSIAAVVLFIIFNLSTKHVTTILLFYFFFHCRLFEWLVTFINGCIQTSLCSRFIGMKAFFLSPARRRRGILVAPDPSGVTLFLWE